MAVVVVATGAREARGCRRGGLSVPKPPKGVVDGRCPATATTTATFTTTTFCGYRGIGAGHHLSYWGPSLQRIVEFARRLYFIYHDLPYR